MSLSLTSPSGVVYSIMVDNGLEEGVEPDGPTATVKFKCAWGDRYVFIRDLVGRSVASGNSSVRVIPMQYPPSTNLYCRPNVRVTGLGQFKTASGWAAYESAIVTATFARPLWAFDNSDPSGSPWTSTSIDPSGQFLTLPESTYRFDDGTPTNTPIGLVLPQATITFTRHWMAFAPLSEAMALAGQVNNAAFAIGNYVFPTGTLLFMPGKMNKSSDAQGNVTWEVEYKFVFDPKGWNNFMHPDRTSGFSSVTDGNGNPPYTQGDFTTLP